MNINEIVNRVSEITGKDVKIKELEKNGIKKQAIVAMNDSKIGTVFYVDSLEEFTTEEAVNFILEILSRDDVPEVSKLTNVDYVLEHLKVGLQKSGTQNLIKKAAEFFGLEMYMYVELEKGIVKVTPDYANSLDISLDELWNRAEENNNRESTIFNFGALIGMPVSPMWIATNDSKHLGASAILNRKMMSDFAKANGVNHLIILPSSIHECIVIPTKNITNEDVEMYRKMVMNVNATTVSPEEVLCDTAFVWNY